MRAPLPLLAAAAMIVAPAARAQDDPTAADLRCVLVATLMTAQPDPAVKNAGLLAGIYYLGRLKGREPALDLEGRLRTLAMQMKADAVKADAARCAAELKGIGEDLKAIGSSLQNTTPPATL